MHEVAGLHAQVDRKRAEEEAQRRAEDAEREAEREEARRRAEADAELKMRYYEVTHSAPALAQLHAVMHLDCSLQRVPFLIPLPGNSEMCSGSAKGFSLGL